MLFEVLETDFTPYIVSKSYQMNRQDSYEEWTDGNGITHRNVYRSKISGSFEMKFINRAAYGSFLAALDAVKTDGYYPVTVYVNNTLFPETIEAFITIEPSMTAQYRNIPEFEQFTVKVVQR